MFTLKHYSAIGSYTVYEATKYFVVNCGSGGQGRSLLSKSISFEPPGYVDGQPRQVISLNHAEHAYISNSEGKTIDHIGPFYEKVSASATHSTE